MKFNAILAAALTAGLAVALPTNTLTRRGDTCGQWDTVQTGPYTVYGDHWGQSAASYGSQCFGVDGLNGNTLKWHTSWTWAGGPDSVKTYTNAVVSLTSTQLSGISSIPSTWSYSYSGDSIVADVSYDMFTSSWAGGSNQYEIMVWLAALGGAGPISSTGSPVAWPYIAGSGWKLYKGPNGDTTVFSFVPDSEITDFAGDLKEFFNYLTANEGMSTSQYLTSIGAGTEPFTGFDAVLTVHGYSTSVYYA